MEDKSVPVIRMSEIQNHLCIKYIYRLIYYKATTGFHCLFVANSDMIEKLCQTTEQINKGYFKVRLYLKALCDTCISEIILLSKDFFFIRSLLCKAGKALKLKLKQLLKKITFMALVTIGAIKEVRGEQN